MSTKAETPYTHEPVFSTDWFTPVIPVWENVLRPYRGRPGVRALEIGSYEGRSALWLLENILTHPSARLDCIDIFVGDPGLESLGVNTDKVLDTFLHNISPHRERVRWMQGKSQLVLRGAAFAPGAARRYDIVYIDGWHEATAVLEDAVLTYRLLKVGGVLIFDDYEFEGWAESYRNPKSAILSFFNIYRQQFKLLHKGRQFILERVRDC